MAKQIGLGRKPSAEVRPEPKPAETAAANVDGEVEANPKPRRTTRSASKSDVVNEGEPRKPRQRRPHSQVPRHNLSQSRHPRRMLNREPNPMLGLQSYRSKERALFDAPVANKSRPQIPEPRSPSAPAERRGLLGLRHRECRAFWVSLASRLIAFASSVKSSTASRRKKRRNRYPDCTPKSERQ